MNKLILSIATFFVGVTLSAQKPVPLPANDILKEAYKQAVKEKKHVFVMFHASWCVWCHKMDTSMNDPSVKKFFDNNYVIRHLVVDESKNKKDQENPGAAALRDQYNGKDQGIPFWLIFDNKGELIADSKVRKDGDGPDKGENVGCPATEKEVNYFIEVLKKTSKLKPEELETIRLRFRKNEI